MESLAGLRWHDGVAAEWHVRIDGDRVLEEGPGDGPPHSGRAVFFDGLTNYHVHLGDAFLTGRDFPRDLEALVRPGTGWKHRELARASRPAIVQGIVLALGAFAERAVTALYDFREQGPEGLMLLREALRQAGPGTPRVVPLGRPARLPPSSAELAALFHLADGVGIPSLTDWGRDACLALADAAHRQRKWVALHFSEAERESADDALSLKPHLLVHLCHATQADLERLAQARVGLVVCPTSNEFFGLPTPAVGLERLGVPWSMGTDNAMLGGRGLLEEARCLKRRHAELSDASLAAALTRPPGKVLNRAPGLEHGGASPPRLAILPLRSTGAVEWDAQPRIARR